MKNILSIIAKSFKKIGNNGTSDTEYILCAAIWYTEFEISEVYKNMALPKNIDKGIVISGYRHLHCIHTFLFLTGKRTVQSECGYTIQGFLTSKNRFVDRKEAARIFKNNGGILKYSKSELYSEDLY